MNRRVRAALVCGGQWHDFDYARRELLGELAVYDQVHPRVYEDYEGLGRLGPDEPLITYTCNVMPSEAQRAALSEFLAAGGRWLALHATNASIVPAAPDADHLFCTPPLPGNLAQLLGSRFLGHPPIAPYTVTPVADHPFTAGIGSFTVTDELYISQLHPPLQVLAHTSFVGESTGFAEGHTHLDEPRPVLYLKRHGAGTVCYFTLGHCRGRYDLADLGVEDLGCVDRGSWTVPEFRTILQRCLHWAVTGELPPAP
ncbi:ThuA domain-containing protein [Mycobacterium sp. UM_Kg1]|uniref:ThuA domain-containing protein n=1 Tax=Mycobacterium sp. UM_Kg1 TaxID=1545691 RepID=UPI000AF863AF|nr:ThuA domain-containing protein [Mycobacterium sp. UM_Kg1]